MFFTKRCPVCSGKMIKFQDDVGRRFAKCTQCNAQFPLDTGFREVKCGLSSKI